MKTATRLHVNISFSVSYGSTCTVHKKPWMIEQSLDSVHCFHKEPHKD